MNIQKVLTFRASSIGDCLMGKYVLENIHKVYPNARLGLIVASRGAMIKDLFARYPWVEVIEVNRRSPRALLSLLVNFYRSDFVITQYAGKPGGVFSLGSKFMARLLAKRGGLIGFTDVSRWNRFLYDRLVPVRTDLAVAEHDRESLRAVGVEVSLPYPTMTSALDASVLRKFGLEAGKYLIVHLFAGSTMRGLSPQMKYEIIHGLAERFPNMRLLISGSVGERGEAVEASAGTSATVIAGEITLQELMGLIAQSTGIVSVDTGVAHITAQMGKPLLVLSTCLGRNWWFPEQYGKDAPILISSRSNLCALGHRYIEYPDCMNAIPVEEVVSHAQDQFRL